jgi:predicted nucleic acid-binding protein
VLIVDTGVLVAAADRKDRFHDECAGIVTDDPGSLVTTATVIAEAAYLIGHQLVAMPRLRCTQRSSKAT